MADRLTQTSVEAVVVGSPKARVTQLAEEAVVVGSPKARLTWTAREVVLPSAGGNSRVTQLAEESVIVGSPKARLTQFAVEAVIKNNSQRGDIAYDQIRGTDRLGPGPQIQMYSGSFPAAGHVPLYDGNGDLIDGGFAPGAGSVTSVGLSMPSDFSVSGSPVTGSGTLTVTGGATKSAIQQESYTYAADTGSANAYAVTLSPAPTIVAGSFVVFKAANANTGASTLAVNGGSATAIKKQGSTALASGDIASGQIIAVVYDGTNFQLIGGSGGGGGGDTTAKYIIGAADATLTNALVWPGLYNSPDAPPASAGSLDDEFDAGSLNTSTRWTWLNQGASTATLQNSRLILTGDGSNNAVRGIYQSAPSTPWEIAVRLAPEDTEQNYQLWGVLLYESATNKVVWFGPFCSAQGIYVGYGSTTTTSSTVNNYAYTSYNNAFWFPSYYKIKNDGTNLKFSHSNDGVFYKQVYTNTVATFFTTAPDKVGIGISLWSSATGTLSVDWFRRTL